jgi:hypothetical protein
MSDDQESVEKMIKWLDKQAEAPTGKNGPGKKKTPKERYKSRYKTIGKKRKK